MRFGVHKMTWGSYFEAANIRAFLEEARQTGAKTAEFRLPEEAMAGNKKLIQEIRAAAEENGLEMLFSFAYPAGLDMRAEDSAVRRKAVEYLRRGIETAAMLGGKELGGVLYAQWPSRYDHDMLNREKRRERQKRSLECIQRAVPEAKSCGILLNLEPLNRYEDYMINTVEEGIAFCREISSPCCKLLLDTFHMNIEEENIEQAIVSAKGFIGHFHAAEPNRMIPHKNGRTDWKRIGDALRQAGYEGSVTIEAAVSFDGETTYNMRIWRDLMKDLTKTARIEAMRQGITYLEQELRKGL